MILVIFSGNSVIDLCIVRRIVTKTCKLRYFILALTIVSGSSFAADKPSIPVIWQVERMQVMQPAMRFIAKERETFKEFPPAQTPESWTRGDVMEKIKNSAGKH